jgi:hypothetical protein
LPYNNNQKNKAQGEIVSNAKKQFSKRLQRPKTNPNFHRKTAQRHTTPKMQMPKNHRVTHKLKMPKILKLEVKKALK